MQDSTRMLEAVAAAEKIVMKPAKVLCPKCENFHAAGDCAFAKPSNPKDIIGSDKLPLGLVSPAFVAMTSLGKLEGALKYGTANYREVGVRMSVYLDACRRHLDAYADGEDVAPDSGTPHLANAAACLDIIVDSLANGTITDDRPKSNPGYRAFIENLTKHVPRLKKLFADKRPVHYLIGGPSK